MSQDSPDVDLRVLAPSQFGNCIQAAFVYGSIAKGTDTAQSDVDLMVICDDLAYSDLYNALQEAEATLQRPVHVSLATTAEWKRKLAAGNPFVTKVQAQPKILLIGSADDLG
jgi:predicted nucleotidyltransferase